jgi:hypothetical protein
MAVVGNWFFKKLTFQKETKGDEYCLQIENYQAGHSLATKELVYLH